METGLPYSFDKMNEIQEFGALVDMSNLSFPCTKDNDDVRIAYIYLRNTDFSKIKLDFSKCSFDYKSRFILFYLFGDIEYNIREMNETWMQILIMFNNEYSELIENDVIMSKDEICEFIKNNKEKIQLLNSFIFSLSLYPIYRLENDKPSFDDIEIIEGKVINNDVIGIIKHKLFNSLLTLDYNDKPYFFKDIFTDDNNILFETIGQYTPYMALLYGMINSSDDEWESFIKGLHTANDSNADE